MPDDPAFIRMIAADPDDDAPRLVYADVLEERGDAASVARAEFIRVQCERARLIPDTPRSRELWFRDAALLDWARLWRAELPAIEGVTYGGFIRGFVDHVTGPTEQMSRHLELISNSLPVRKMTLLQVTASAARRLVKARDLTQVAEMELSFYRGFSLAALRVFASRGPWPRLRRLCVPGLCDFDSGQRGFGRQEALKSMRAAFGDRLTT